MIRSADRRRCLWHGLPELRVVAVEDAGAPSFQRSEPLERGQHRLSVVNQTRQSPLAQRAAEVAGIRGQDDLATIEPHFQRLMPRRVAISRQAGDRAVAGDVVLAVDQQ